MKKIFGVELKDAGKKEKPLEGVKVEGSKGKELETRYPEITSYGVVVPGLENLEVGKKYIMVAVVDVARISTVEEKKGKKERSGSLNILECGFKEYKKKSVGEMSEEEIDEKLKNGDVEEEE